MFKQALQYICKLQFELNNTNAFNIYDIQQRIFLGGDYMNFTAENAAAMARQRLNQAYSNEKLSNRLRYSEQVEKLQLRINGLNSNTAVLNRIEKLFSNEQVRNRIRATSNNQRLTQRLPVLSGLRNERANSKTALNVRSFSSRFANETL